MAGFRAFRRRRVFAPRSLYRGKRRMHPVIQRQFRRSYSRYRHRGSNSKWRRRTSRSYNRFGSRRRVKPMKSISCTLQHPETGQYQWERFTTKGIPDQCRRLAAFVCHYQLNIIPRGDPLGTDKLCTFKRTTDMVRVRGIGYQMSFVLQPKSGF